MKIGKSLFFLVVLGLSIVSCEPEVGFTEPQPSDVENAEKFKRKFTGKYLCVEDSSILIVSKREILRNWNFEVTVDSNENIETAVRNINVDADEADLVITPNDDSSSYIVDFTKEVFKLGNNRILKYEDRICYLNYENSDGTWEVRILKFDNDGYLTINDLSLGVGDLEEIRNTTEVSEKTDEEGKVIAYQIQPSRKEFDELLNTDFYESGQKFIKIK